VAEETLFVNGQPIYVRERAQVNLSKVGLHLRKVMPDLKDIKNPVIGKDSRNLVVQFSTGEASVHIPFGDLSDGEKCFMICALVITAR
jgi:hypothetical protein